MRPPLPLPDVLDLDVQICADGTSCLLDVFTEAPLTADDEEALRRTLAPTLSRTLVEEGVMSLLRLACLDPETAKKGPPRDRHQLVGALAIAWRTVEAAGRVER